MGRRQYKRSIAIKFGGASAVPINPTDAQYSIMNLDDNGVRIAFRFTRNNRGDADRGMLRIWNLSKATRETIANDLDTLKVIREGIQRNKISFPTDDARAAALKEITDKYLVTVFAGYDKKPEAIFRGDMMNVRTKRQGSVDFVTEIELGDTLLALRDGYMNRAFGTGAFMENIVRSAIGASGLDLDAASSAILSAVAPNATITQTTGGYYAVGRPADTISEIIDMFGLQWWARDGKIFFVPQGSVTQDSSIVLQDGKDLYAFQQPEGFGVTKGKGSLNARIHPGRGLILKDENGLPISAAGFRTDACVYEGDTHGPAWFTSFEATEATQAIIPPPNEFAEP